MTRLKIGLQMYTLRSETANDFLGTLRKVAELGYEGVEFAGYGGLDAKTLRAELDALGLQAIGAHVPLPRMLEAAEEEIEYMLTLGGKYIVVPWMGPETYESESALADTCGKLESAAKLCAERGIVFGYHNHAFELEIRLKDRRLLDAIFAGAPSLQAELDACWVHKAGVDPAEYIRKYAGRLPLVHLKDMAVVDGEVQTVELGKGEVNLAAIAAAAKEAGSEWLIVEQDHCANPPLESVATSIGWIRDNGLLPG